ncbi:hypothetical protein BUALT_Bualt15G0118100 [Buddleja alternifolia]|uniref:Calmodulin-binding protein n=1 Tax=Buddleja alternifolia TaxID=168488 RepID=A0AAV6WEF7_9LAMI|nr:hypothetical protein BUALT_Bualt15G0118100 [Buddleja alternifolia]
MVLKRQLKEEGSELPVKRRHLLSNIYKGLNNARYLQESAPSLEPIIRKWVQEAVEHAINPLLRSSCNQIECSRSRTLQLQFHSNLPHTLFTGSRIVSEDRNPIKIILYDSTSKQIITSGPLSSIKVTIVVLDGDFGPDDQEEWSKKDFDRKILQNREGKRPLVTGELTVPLKDGVGYIGEVSFTDNSSWIRSGKFRLGAKVRADNEEISIREAMSNAFKVKDHRGESYQKHYPPRLDDEVWRLKKIAKDGASHKRLSRFGISSVGDFLRLYVKDEYSLRALLGKISNKRWEMMIRHATTCTLDEQNLYMFRTAQGIGMLFNSIYKVVGVTFDGHNYQSLDSLDIYQRRVAEDLKQLAYKNSKDWISVNHPSIMGYPMLLKNPATDNINNPDLGLQDSHFHMEQDQLEMQMNTNHPRITLPYNREVEQDNRSFTFGESSLQIQGFDTTLRNNVGMSDSLGRFYIGGNYVEKQLSTDDLPVDDNFWVESSSAWKENAFLGSRCRKIGLSSSNNGILIPRNTRPKTRWCKLLAVIKWRILVRRNVAERKWKQFYNYI